MIPVRDTAQGATFAVKVHPRARRNAVRLARHQKAEHVEPRRLRKRRQGGYGLCFIHTSRLTDVSETASSPLPKNSPKRSAMARETRKIELGRWRQMVRYGCLDSMTAGET